ncbi:MAG: magnesium transporter [Deltaproteobacteria bacterium]|nr:magnesium transporter [Deltaproteobacteria bacterium]
MKNPLLVPELREYIQKNETEKLIDFCETSSPVVIADFLSALSAKEVLKVLAPLSSSTQAEIFSYLDLDIQAELAERLPRRDLARILSDMPHDDRVDLLKKMPEDRQEAILPAMAQAEREDIRRLAAYPEESAGSVMTSDYAALPPDITAADAIDRLRREAPDKETIYYAYVVDKSRKLIGFISLKDLILAKPYAHLGDIMNEDVIFARVTDDQEDVARTIQKYDLIALPVINGEDSLVGIITHDDAFDIITQEQTEDMEKMMAIAGDHEAGVYLQTSAWTHLKNRIGWIIALAFLGLVSGYIVQSFESMLVRFAILASFMPMLADTGGNTGSQSATLVIRALALQEIKAKDILNVLSKELLVALPLGLVLAVLAWLRVYFFAGSSRLPPGFSMTRLGIAVAIALGLQVVTATLIGATLPLIADRLNLDPAVIASPALTTIVDITGLLIFFITAKIILGL